MKQRVKSLLWIALLSLLAFSCRTGNDSGPVAPLPEPTAEKRLIPMEDAMALLSEFLKSSDKYMPPTRSGAPRKIASVSTYFRGNGNIATKAASETGDNLPSAYLVNFEDGEGLSNGYFSTNCLNSSKAEGYDDPSLDNTSERYSYRWHFRIITYDVPSDSCTVIINYSY